MAYVYKRVDTQTVKGIETAEKMIEQGWIVISAGLETVLMETPKEIRRVER